MFFQRHKFLINARVCQFVKRISSCMASRPRISIDIIALPVPNTIVICFYGWIVHAEPDDANNWISLFSSSMRNHVWCDRNFNVCDKLASLVSGSAEVKREKWHVFAFAVKWFVNGRNLRFNKYFTSLIYISHSPHAIRWLSRCAVRRAWTLIYWKEKRRKRKQFSVQTMLRLFIARTHWPQNMR